MNTTKTHLHIFHCTKQMILLKHFFLPTNTWAVLAYGIFFFHIITCSKSLYCFSCQWYYFLLQLYTTFLFVEGQACYYSVRRNKHNFPDRGQM
jgi:hypothetical protein